jgi:hypothetical protein
MSLATGVATLKKDIKVALQKVRDSGKQTGTNSNSIISQLSSDLAVAIQKYMESAQVITTHTINPGQIALIAPGVVTTPGAGQGSNGTLKFSSNAGLKSQIQVAYQNANDLGRQDGQNSDIIISQLAIEIANAINVFALTGIVETDIEVPGGATVTGLVAGGIPVPAFTGPGNGKGTGKLQ